MRETPQARAARREAFRRLPPREKAEYVLAYYKVPICAALLALAALGVLLHGRRTKPDTLLYAGCANLSTGSAMEQALSAEFIRTLGADGDGREVTLLTGLYLSDDPPPEDHSYAYASRLKVMASVEAKRLDVVLMNREAYDLLSESGYLLPLPPLLARDPALSRRLVSALASNRVILEDNGIAYRLNEAETHETVTEEVQNGVELSRFPLFQQAGLDGAVYLGVLANSPRLDCALRYLDYLTSAGG